MEIAVAARGWLGSEWDAFFPQDLPADWRLDYYANEFFAVLVPYTQWRDASDEALLEWLEQVSEDFLFFWEVLRSDDAALTRLQELLDSQALFAEHWGGIVDSEMAELQPQPPIKNEQLALLKLAQPMELRPLRERMEQALQAEAKRLLVLVEAQALESIRPARDLAQLLAG